MAPIVWEHDSRPTTGLRITFSVRINVSVGFCDVQLVFVLTRKNVWAGEASGEPGKNIWHVRA